VTPQTKAVMRLKMRLKDEDDEDDEDDENNNGDDVDDCV
jgi:hypothetical protein